MNLTVSLGQIFTIDGKLLHCFTRYETEAIAIAQDEAIEYRALYNSCITREGIYNRQKLDYSVIIDQKDKQLGYDKYINKLNTDHINTLEKSLKKEIRKGKAIKIGGFAVVGSVVILLILK